MIHQKCFGLYPQVMSENGFSIADNSWPHPETSTCSHHTAFSLSRFLKAGMSVLSSFINQDMMLTLLCLLTLSVFWREYWSSLAHTPVKQLITFNLRALLELHWLVASCYSLIMSRLYGLVCAGVPIIIRRTVELVLSPTLLYWLSPPAVWKEASAPPLCLRHRLPHRLSLHSPHRYHCGC